MSTEGVVQLEVGIVGTTKAVVVTDAALAAAFGAGQVYSETDAELAVAFNADSEPGTRATPGLVVGVAAKIKVVAKTSGACQVACAADGDGYSSNASNARYELYHLLGDGRIDFTTPAETFTSLPHTTSATFTGTGKHRFVIRRRNSFLRVDSGRREHVVHVRDTDQSWAGPPSEPYDLEIVQYANRYAEYRAKYFPTIDAEAGRQATHFVFWFTTDGSEPNELSAPDYSEGMRTIVAGIALLDKIVTSPALANGTTVRAKFATRYQDASGWQASVVREADPLVIDDSAPPAPELIGDEYLRRGR